MRAGGAGDARAPRSPAADVNNEQARAALVRRKTEKSLEYFCLLKVFIYNFNKFLRVCCC